MSMDWKTRTQANECEEGFPYDTPMVTLEEAEAALKNMEIEVDKRCQICTKEQEAALAEKDVTIRARLEQSNRLMAMVEKSEVALAEMTKQRNNYANSECKLVEQVGNLQAQLTAADMKQCEECGREDVCEAAEDGCCEREEWISKEDFARIAELEQRLTAATRIDNHNCEIASRAQERIAALEAENTSLKECEYMCSIYASALGFRCVDCTVKTPGVMVVEASPEQPNKE